MESGSGGVKKENKPWFDSECREAKKEARHALTKVRMLVVGQLRTIFETEGDRPDKSTNFFPGVC